MATPYLSQGRTTRYEDRCDLEDIVNFFPVPTMHQRRQLVTLILDAGFTRPRTARVTRLQLWSYFIETVLLLACAMLVADTGQPFVWGALTALTVGSTLTFLGGLVINHGIKKGFRK